MLFVWLLSSSFLPFSFVWADPLKEGARKIESIISSHPYKNLGISVVDLASGAPLVTHQDTRPLKPASVLKIVSSLAALEYLGPDFRFETQAFYEKDRAGRSVLYVRGGGDPGFTVESMWVMARGLKRRGLREIDEIVVDESLFAGDSSARQGQRAYQAGSSPVPYNFNTVAFEVCPGQVGQPASVVPDPWEIGIRLSGSINTVAQGSGTFEIDEVAPLSATNNGTFRISGTFGSQRSCATIYRSVSSPSLYFGRALASALELVGVQGPKKVSLTREPITVKAGPLYTHRSKPFGFVLQDLNNFSNNFIAEQLLMALGGDQTGNGFSRAVGLRRMETFLRSARIDPSQFQLLDASGLSHENKLSAKSLTQLLAGVQQLEFIRPEFENSLSVPGRDGTLRGRKGLLSSAALVRAKTGTLTGVSSLSGYVISRSGRKLAFSILQNDAPSKDRAIEFEDRVVKVLMDL